MKKMLLFAALFLSAATALYSQDVNEDLDATYATELLPAGTLAPEFEIQDMSGKTVRLSISGPHGVPTAAPTYQRLRKS